MTYSKYNFDAPTDRVLAVLDKVAMEGPCTLSHLAQCLPFPRAAIWRALSILKRVGWVKCRRGDHAYSINHQRALAISSLNISHYEVDVIDDVLEYLSTHSQYKFAVHKLVDYGKCAVIEANAANLYTKSDHSLILDDAAICALTTVASRANFERHISQYLKGATVDERADYNAGVFQAKIEKVKMVGFLIDPIWSSVCVPITRSGVIGCSLSVIDQNSRSRDQQRLIRLANSAVAMFREMAA